MVDRAEGQLFLCGENARFQPFFQRQILAVAAEEGHGGVAVRIAESGHQEVAPAVDHLVRLFILGQRLGNLRNFAVLDRNVHPFVPVAVLWQERCVLQ